MTDHYINVEDGDTVTVRGDRGDEDLALLRISEDIEVEILGDKELCVVADM